MCCKLFWINISKDEYESRKFKTVFQEYGFIENFTKAKKCGANLLAKNDQGGCIYLVDNKCSVHATRPEVCKKFFCTSRAKKFNEMIKLINKNK